MLKIEHQESDSKGSFYYEEDSLKVAELTYSKAGIERIIIDHTEVFDDYRGEGLGKKLVFHLVEYARKRRLKVLPLCPYARSIFHRYPKLTDVL